MTDNELIANITALNLANSVANRLHPALAEYFTPLIGQKIIKADGSLIAKHKDKVAELIAQFERPSKGTTHNNVRITRFNARTSLAYDISVCERVPNEEHCTYKNVVIYIGDMPGDSITRLEPVVTDRPTAYNLEKIKAAQAEYKRLQALADKAKDEIPYFAQ